jgi:hypothetical protein
MRLILNRTRNKLPIIDRPVLSFEIKCTVSFSYTDSYNCISYLIDAHYSQGERAIYQSIDQFTIHANNEGNN